MCNRSWPLKASPLFSGTADDHATAKSIQSGELHAGELGQHPEPNSPTWLPTRFAKASARTPMSHPCNGATLQLALIGTAVVANLRPIANRPARVTTLGQAVCHVIFRP